MKTKAIIFDLDNTIYPVSQIGQKLFLSLFTLIEENGNHNIKLNEIKSEIMRKPFQAVVKDFSFSEILTQDCIKLLSNLTYNDRIHPFADYFFTKKIECLKFLVTTGFTKLQLSKIHCLEIKNDFHEIFIVDPEISSLTKKDYFKEIITRYKLNSEELLIIGDDLNSEIKAGKELGIKTILNDFRNHYQKLENQIVINSFSQLENFLK